MPKICVKKVAPLPATVLVALLAAAMIAPQLATPILQAAPASAKISGTPADKLAVGDTWTYIDPTNESNNITATVTGIEKIKDWNEREVECYKIQTTRSSSPMLLVHYVKADEADRVTVALKQYFKGNETYGGETVYTEIDLMMYFDPYMSDLDFPLENGKKWTSIAISYMTGYSNMYYYSTGEWFNVTYDRSNATSGILIWRFEVLNSTYVTVRAGTFETWCINQTLYDNPSSPISSSVMYYSPKVKNVVLIEDDSGSRVMELASYSVSYPTQQQMMMASLLLFSYVQSQSSRTTLLTVAGAGVAVAAIAAVALVLLRARRTV